jgi:hypothetical protein
MRVAGWNRLLSAEITRVRTMPAKFGEHDCCTWAAHLVRLMTGVDHRVKFPEYHSREESEAILAQYCGMRGLAVSVLGEPLEPAHASIGDLVLLPARELGETVGVCLGDLNVNAESALGIDVIGR